MVSTTVAAASGEKCSSRFDASTTSNDASASDGRPSAMSSDQRLYARRRVCRQLGPQIDGNAAGGPDVVDPVAVAGAQLEDV